MYNKVVYYIHIIWSAYICKTLKAHKFRLFRKEITFWELCELPKSVTEAASQALAEGEREREREMTKKTPMEYAIL